MRERCGIFDVSHMGEIETAGPQAAELLQRLLSNDVSQIPVGGAQYSVLCREDGGVLDDLFTYRLDAGALHDGHERVEPRERPRVVSRPRRRPSTCEVEDRIERLRDARRAGSPRARDRAGDLRYAAAGAHDARARAVSLAPRCSCAAPATPARRA